MAGLMPTVDSMSEVQQEIVKAMSDAARDVMREHGYQPLNDDRCAIFDEACAVYLRQSDDAWRKRIALEDERESLRREAQDRCAASMRGTSISGCDAARLSLKLALQRIDQMTDEQLQQSAARRAAKQAA